MAMLSSGYICISMPGDRLDELQLALMVPNNEEKHKTAYTVTVDYKYGRCITPLHARASL